MMRQKIGLCLVLVGLMIVVGCSERAAPKIEEKTLGPVYDAATVGKLLGIHYSEKELQPFGDHPKPLSGYVTFFDPGLSVLQLRSVVRGKGAIFYHEDQDFLDTELFAKLMDGPTYRQLLMREVPGSEEKTFDDQKKCLSPEDEIPTVRQIAMGMVIHFLASGDRLYETYWLRCAGKDSTGRGTAIGAFYHMGLMISCGRPDDVRRRGFGLAAVRRSSP